jgi:hypothetical protein
MKLNPRKNFLTNLKLAIRPSGSTAPSPQGEWLGDKEEDLKRTKHSTCAVLGKRSMG